MENVSKLFRDRYELVQQTYSSKNEVLFLFGLRMKMGLKFIEIPDNRTFPGRFHDWDSQLFLNIKFGNDDEGKSEEDFGGIIFYEYCIKRATSFNRPDWAFYYWLGELCGLINSKQEPKEELVRCVPFFPKTFFKMHAEKVMELWNYFDELGEQLHIDAQGEEIKVWFERKAIE